MSARRDLSFTRGDSWVHTFKFEDADGNPLDISGWSWAAQVRRDWVSALVVEFVTEVTGPGNNVLVIRANPPDTDVVAAKYRWDLERSANGSVQTLLSGQFTVAGDITRV